MRPYSTGLQAPSGQPQNERFFSPSQNNQGPLWQGKHKTTLGSLHNNCIHAQIVNTMWAQKERGEVKRGKWKTTDSVACLPHDRP